MDAQSLENKTLDDLFLDLGRELYSTEGFGGDDIRRIRARARRWFTENTTTIRTHVCPHAQSTGDAAMDLAALADVLTAFLDKPAGAIVAAIVLKTGLRSFCKGFPDDH